MSRVTAQVEGKAAELLFAVMVMLGSRGTIKAGLQLVDDEGRDVEIHLGGRFRAAFAIQVKASRKIRREGPTRRLWLVFQIGADNVIDDPCFWYFFAYLDMKELRISEYVFLVPSSEVHAMVRRSAKTGRLQFTFHASMSPDHHDRWTPYRLKTTELAPRLMDLMRKAPRQEVAGATLAALAGMPGLCWLGHEPEEAEERS